MPPPLRVLETCLYAEDLAAARRFYGTVLELRLHSEVEERHVFFHCGAGMLLIFDPSTTSQPHAEGLPPHGSRGTEHVCWAVDRQDFAAWRDHLVSHSVAIEHEQTWPNGARSIYFRDPAGNSLEFATPRLWENDPD